MKRRDVQHSPDALSLKLATEALVGAVGGPDKAAGYSRPGRRFFSDYVVPNCDAFIPVDAVVDLEKRAVGTLGYPQVTRELCRQHGGVFVPVPQAGSASIELSRCAAEHAKEANDVTTRILSAVTGGKLTARAVEASGLVRECQEAVEAAVRLCALVEMIAGEGA